MHKMQQFSRLCCSCFRQNLNCHLKKRNSFGISQRFYKQNGSNNSRASTKVKIGGLEEAMPKTSSSNNKNIKFSAYALLVVPAFTLSLGIWQIKRRKWKINLINNMEKKLYSKPHRLPEVSSDIETMEYTPIEVVGEFDHSREIIIYPRTRSEDTPVPPFRKSGIPILGDQSGHGAQVVTPFRLADRDAEILVNRGWVAKGQLNPETRKEGQLTGPIKLVGILRLTERKPLGVKENDPEKGYWFYRNVEEMATHAGTAPIYLEASYKSSVPNGPLGGQTNVNIRNEHWQYILTWFSLSGFTAYMWYLRFMK